MPASFTSTKPGLCLLATGVFVFGSGGHATFFEDVWSDIGADCEYEFIAPYDGYLAVKATTSGLEADIGASLAVAASGWPSTFIPAGTEITLRIVGSDSAAGAAISAKVQFYGLKKPFDNTAPTSITLS